MTKPLKMVLVEDDKGDAELLLHELRRSGFVPECTIVDAEDAYLAALEETLDLIISDYRLPNFSGLRALDLLHQSELSIPFILVSGAIGEETAVEAIKNGADDYLLKDRLTRLGTAVEQAMEAVRLRREKRRAETKYQTIFNEAMEGIYQSTPDGRFLTVNPAMARMGGYDSPEQMIREVKNIGEELYVDPAYRLELQRQIQAYGAVLNFEIQVRRRDGKIIWISTNIREMREWVGGPVYFSGTVIDITERKKAEAALRYHETLLKETGELARIGGWEYDYLTGQDTWTEPVAKILEVDLKQKYPEKFSLSLFRGEYRVLIEQAIQDAIDHRTMYDMEAEIITAKGNRRWIRTIGRPVVMNGRVVRLRGSCQDITDRKQSEANLRESEERFRQIAENINEVFWMTDAEKGKMLYVSPAYEKIWARTCDSLYENPANWLDAIHPEDAEAVALAARTKQSRGDYDETYRIVRPDGSERWIRDRAYPIQDRSGRVYRIVGTAQDITEQSQLEVQFRQAQKMEAIGTLAGGIAHDFNNILGGIMGYAELAGLHVQSNTPAMEYLNLLIQGTHRAAALTRQILSFSREQEQPRQLLQLRHVVAEPLNLLRSTLPSTIALHASYHDELPAVLADATQIHQIVMNLCTNASHAMRNRPGRLEVKLEKIAVDEALARTVSNLRVGPYVRLTVSDTGHGMDAATLEHIFEPFFTTKAPGEGTGLGLAATRNIMRGHEGAIQVISQPDQGTSFHLYFPAQSAPAETLPSVPTEVPRGKGEHLLFVDDEESLMLLGRAMLEELGYTVTSTSSAKAALDTMCAGLTKFDLVITDLTMPEMTGLELIRQLREMRPEMPFILSTGDTAGFDSNQIKVAEGIREILLKPHTLMSLGSSVNRVLVRQRKSLIPPS